MHSVISSSWSSPLMRLVITALFVVACCATVQAQNGTWTNTTDGQWENSANWSGGTIANGANNTADFNTLDIVNLGAPFFRAGVGMTDPRTIGHMIFGDTNTATPGAWEVYVNSGTPVITLAGTNPSITVNPLGPIDTGTPPVIDDAIIRPPVAGTSGLTKLGTGVLSLAGANTFTGGINVNAGTLRLLAATPEQPVSLANGTTIESFGPLRDVTVAAGGTATVRLTSGPNGVGGILPGGAGTSLNFHTATTQQVEIQRDWAGFANLNMVGEGATATPFRLHINSNTGAANIFNGNSFATTNLHLDNVNIFVRTNSFGNTIPIGQLTGTSTAMLSGGNAGSAARYEIGSSNTSSTFDGTINGAGGISINKVGTGTLTLAGTFTGSPALVGQPAARQGGVFRVTAGTLRITGAASIPGGSGAVLTTIDVLPGATFDVSGAPGTFTTSALQKIQGGGTVLGNYNHADGRIQAGDVGAPTAANEGNLSAGVTPTAGTLTFNGNLALAGGDIMYDMSPTPAGPNDLVQVTGTTTLTSGRILPSFLGAAPAAGQTYTVLNSTGGFSGSPSNLTVDFPGRAPDPVPFTTGSNLQFTTPAGGIVTADIVWSGAVSSAWDVETTQNWVNVANPDVYFNFDDVTFNESAGNKTVTLNTVVNPTSIEINNTSDYAFSGTGAIVGPTGLTKTGSGSLTMNLNNTFTGPASVAGSTVNIMNTATGLGTGALTLNNATLISTVSVGNSSLDIPTGTTSTVQLDGAAGTGGTANIPSLTGGGTLNLTSTVADKYFGTFNTANFTGTLNVAPTSPATLLGQIRIRGGQTDFSNAVVNLTATSVSNQQGAAANSYTTVGFGEVHADASSNFSAFNGGSTPPDMIWQIGALNTNSDIAGVISDGAGSGADPSIAHITKVGTGTLTLTGANTYTGNTKIQNGTLSMTNPGLSLADTADVIMSTGAVFNLNWSGTDAIRSLYIDGKQAAAGTWGAIGSSATNQSALFTGTGVLNVQTFVATALLGDYNSDGNVDAGDYVVWRENNGTTNVLPNNPYPGQIGAVHYNQWLENFGRSLSPGAAASLPGTNVPEPTGLLLVLTGAAAIVCRCRPRLNKPRGVAR